MDPAPRRRRRFRTVSIFWLLPNVLTVAGLITGLTALRFALAGKWPTVIGLIALAAVFDALDGRMSSRFNSSSAFGAALDSLRELVVFGVFPPYVSTCGRFRIRGISPGGRPCSMRFR